MFLAKKVLALAVLYALTNSIATEAETTETPSGTQKYCGKNLVNILTLVCGGVYNYQMTPKGGIYFSYQGPGVGLGKYYILCCGSVYAAR